MRASLSTRFNDREDLEVSFIYSVTAEAITTSIQAPHGPTITLRLIYRSRSSLFL